MENSLYTALSRQVALGEKMDTIANNMANMSTPGYRASNMVFKEFLNTPKASQGKEDVKDDLSMVEDYGQYSDTSAGPLQQTGNPLDVAIQGDGWFGVQTPAGLRYTRAGNFTMNAEGQVVTSAGYKVANPSGGEISIPGDAGAIAISADGRISGKDGQIGQLMLVHFANDQAVKPEGNGLYTTAQAAAPVDPVETKIEQGMLEGSNVKPVLETTRMLDVSRAYTMTQQMIENEHDRQRSMIQKLTQNS